MVITVRLDSHRPPAGTVQALSRPAVPFVGWLGLLGALGRMIDESVAPAGDGRSELDARRKPELRQDV